MHGYIIDVLQLKHSVSEYNKQFVSNPPLSIAFDETPVNDKLEKLIKIDSF